MGTTEGKNCCEGGDDPELNDLGHPTYCSDPEKGLHATKDKYGIVRFWEKADQNLCKGGKIMYEAHVECHPRSCSTPISHKYCWRLAEKTGRTADCPKPSKWGF